MTVLGWDASHYDGTLSTEILNRAYQEGIRFFTHKIGEGLSDTEGTNDDTALSAAKTAGIPFIGGYFVPRTLDAIAQVNYWWSILNAGEPWWKDFPGWFNQIDLERWSYDNVSAAKGIDCAKRWRDKTGRQTILYASHGQYGDELTSWDGPLWNADYSGVSAAGFSNMYPGDNWRPVHGGWTGGWAAYSGQEPLFLQYTSSAIIAGLSTCDANAFRGSEDQLRSLIGGEMALKDDPDWEAFIFNWNWLFPRVQAMALRTPPINGPEQGQNLPVLQWMTDVQTDAAKAASNPTPVALTDADKQAIVADLLTGITPLLPSAKDIVAAVKQAEREGTG